MSKQVVPVAVLELRPVLQFIRGCAMTHALSESAKLEWKTYDDSTFLNVVYGIFAWKEKPGYAEVQIASGKKLQMRFEALAHEWTDNWLKRMYQGPGPMVKYLDSLSTIRQIDAENLASIFRDAKSINQQVEQELNSAIRTFAAVKLGATVAVALLGGGAAIAIGFGATGVAVGGATIAFGSGAMGFGAASAGFSITCSVIKEWNSVPGAKLMAVSKDVGKAVGGEVADRTADKILKTAAASESLQQQLYEKACRQIDHYSRMIAETARQRVKNRATKKLGEALVKHTTAEEGLKRAGNMARAGSVLKVGAPIVFAAWDIWDGISDYNETVGQLK